MGSLREITTTFSTVLEVVGVGFSTRLGGYPLPTVLEEKVSVFGFADDKDCRYPPVDMYIALFEIGVDCDSRCLPPLSA
jgi:hypothetical protein